MLYFLHVHAVLCTHVFLNVHCFLRATYPELSVALSSVRWANCSVVDPSTKQTVREGVKLLGGLFMVLGGLFKLFGGLFKRVEGAVQSFGRVVQTVPEGCGAINDSSLVWGETTHNEQCTMNNAQ